MLKRVLVPLDGSLLALTALDVAIQLADSTCEIILLAAVQEPDVPNYVVTPISLNPEYYPTLETLESNGKRYLEGIADSLRQQGYHVSTRVEVGEPAESILFGAAKMEVDLIVMSTHGRTGVPRWLYGSVTSRVLSKTTLPVLVVPNQGVLQHGGKVAEKIFA